VPAKKLSIAQRKRPKAKQPHGGRRYSPNPANAGKKSGEQKSGGKKSGAKKKPARKQQYDRERPDNEFRSERIPDDERRLPPLLRDTAPQAGIPLVAICGRPNVGKSTLFNRLTGSRRSIVGDEPGITRDRIYGVVEWLGRRFRLVDTGGIVPDDAALIPSEIFRQARVALDEAAAVVMVVDGRTELASSDLELARLLQRTGKPLFLAVNKIDAPQLAAGAQEYHRLGLKNLIAISAEHGSGIGDLLDAVFKVLPVVEDTPENEPPAVEEIEETDASREADENAPRLLRTHGEYEQRETKVAIIGRPNVGKSTLLNALTGTNRAIVSSVAGTTRDAVDEVVERNGHSFRFIDTAGIRRKGKTTLMAEKLSVVMARKHLEAADVALLMIDATEGVTALDATIGGYAHESGRSVVIAINKWDLMTDKRTDGKPPADQRIFEQQVRHALKYLDYAPVIFLSAVEKRNVQSVFTQVVRVAAERRKRVSTGQMNRFLDKIDFQRASVPMANRVRIYYMTQAAVAPPTFVLFTDRDVKLHFGFERFLENQIRAAFGFEGAPIWFKVKARNKKKER
jgi:GTP-binding protein